MTGRRRFLPLLALVMLSLYWGYSWVWSKLALMDAGQFTFCACRMLVAAASLLLALPLLPLLPLLFLLRRPLRPDTLLELVLLGLVGLSGLIGLSMWAPVEGGGSARPRSSCWGCRSGRCCSPGRCWASACKNRVGWPWRWRQRVSTAS